MKFKYVRQFFTRFRMVYLSSSYDYVFVTFYLPIVTNLRKLLSEPKFSQKVAREVGLVILCLYQKLWGVIELSSLWLKSQFSEHNDAKPK